MRSESTGDILPEVPDKRYYLIGEVSQLCAVKPHVLRYWEQEFSVLQPTKRRGNRRYYQYHDVLLIRHIRKLLYADGYTINGAKAQLAKGDATELTKQIKAGYRQSMLADRSSQLLNSLRDELAEIQQILS